MLYKIEAGKFLQSHFDFQTYLFAVIFFLHSNHAFSAPGTPSSIAFPSALNAMSTASVINELSPSSVVIPNLVQTVIRVSGESVAVSISPVKAPPSEVLEREDPPIDIGLIQSLSLTSEAPKFRQPYEVPAPEITFRSTAELERFLDRFEGLQMVSRNRSIRYQGSGETLSNLNIQRLVNIFPNLIALELDSVQLSEEAGKHLGTIQNLESLFFLAPNGSETRSGDAILSAFSPEQAARFQALAIHRAHLSAKVVQQNLPRFSDLKVLALSLNPNIGDSVVRAINRPEILVHLDLEQTDLNRDTIESHFGRFHGLDYLDLSGNPGIGESVLTTYSTHSGMDISNLGTMHLYGTGLTPFVVRGYDLRFPADSCLFSGEDFLSFSLESQSVLGSSGSSDCNLRSCFTRVLDRCFKRKFD